MTEKWKVIGGFGAHIKSTKDNLIIHYKGSVTEIPIREMSHLLIIGGHNLHTSVISTLINHGICISFCESDGQPVGYIIPYDYNSFENLQILQESVLPYSYAFLCAKASIESRLLAIGQYAEVTPQNILFTGELAIIKGYSEELKNLVKIEELRRIERLVHDMYYEIISRLLHPSYKFNRRSRPYIDPVNAILSFGYGMLISACRKSLIGGHLNPSKGFLNQGSDALVKDLISGWKPEMVDRVTIEYITTIGLSKGSFQIVKDRCILSENLINELIPLFQKSIDLNLIDNQTTLLIKSLRNEGAFEVIRMH
jgi:CRISP-associated protein Cas1